MTVWLRDEAGVRFRIGEGQVQGYSRLRLSRQEQRMIQYGGGRTSGRIGVRMTTSEGINARGRPAGEGGGVAL